MNREQHGFQSRIIPNEHFQKVDVLTVIKKSPSYMYTSTGSTDQIFVRLFFQVPKLVLGTYLFGAILRQLDPQIKLQKSLIFFHISICTNITLVRKENQNSQHILKTTGRILQQKMTGQVQWGGSSLLRPHTYYSIECLYLEIQIQT